ncbi:hypothetical protein [Anaerotignum propionicum]|uniref:Uncharacterized protein n=1 Tax=Anaerotignum propionicum DSM 1682 TaxID=991789 RepID=A0A110A738_ANAPI|nr:hypothetical protein [Anaerotignum propionicum]AMJ40466.1 hypothetical protein CPRO_08660 [Anaerotignum propionicum DSM 1682]SHE41345.1 hypothetical protein SAMN02745151_00617 [[Clostridium] propionicum DSM 1682] [Anaerotignum propionicum DSM 1682]
MFQYAQLNQEKICVGISQLSGKVDAENMILINEDAEVLGMQYNNGIWEKLAQLEPNAASPSELEQMDTQQMDTQQIMQAFTDVELRNLEIQQRQELLAQQIANIELAMLGGNT